MKITDNSSDLLILDETPWLIGLILAGVIVIATICVAILPFRGYPEGLIGLPFLIIGTILFKGFVRRDQAVFDRSAGTVTLRHRTLTSYASETIPLDTVEHAEVRVSQQTRTDGRGPTDVYCPAIRVQGELRPLSNLSTNSRRHHETVDVLNEWLGKPSVPERLDST